MSTQSATISCDVTLFIRLLEVAREELKSDEQLHQLVERCSEAQATKGEGAFLTMDDYQTLVPPKEEKKLNAATRIRAAKGPNLPAFKAALVTLCQTYWPSIPMQKIAGEGEKAGIALLDDDGTLWEGILTGREGRCSIDLGDVRSNIPIKKKLHLQWHKMESGKYEINCYTD